MWWPTRAGRWWRQAGGNGRPEGRQISISWQRIIAGWNGCWRAENCNDAGEAFLGLIPPPTRALLVGEGNGRFLAALRRAYPQVQGVCVDASSRMLERARTSLKAAGLGVEGIQFVQADILEWTPPAREFNLVASNFVLDCFPPEQLEGLVGRLAGAAKPESRWLLSDFCEAPAGLGKWRARFVLGAMYLFFGWTTGLPAG